ncbi:hypothetical protein ACFU99_06625, partial [Streptomyces sp. NPDC057654]|uniref:hypothetical protein n=1 Tax=Streptomyces sp. NPDC057654 TaxID=3346196 RepID=UPI0036C87E86
GPALGRGIAARLARPVLYEAELFRPSAYWVVTPDGAHGRARLHGPRAEGGGQPGYVLDAAEIPVPGLPNVPVEIIYEAIGDRCGFAFAEALRGIVDALAECCPHARTAVLRGSLATDTADRFSDFDLVWTVPDADFAACVASVASFLNTAHPLLLPPRSDPDFRHRADRRLLFFSFRDLPLFWRLDLEVRAESGSPAGPAAPAGGGWPLSASALANAVGAVKAVRRDRPDTACGLLDRGFERVGSERRATGRWPEDVRRLVDAAVAGEKGRDGGDGRDEGVRALADRVRELVATELEGTG